MEGKLAVTRHFFKIMLPGFHEKLNLPHAFCKKLKFEKSENGVITSSRGMCKIKVCRNPQGQICFLDGWPIFVHLHGLNIGDFVLFEHIGDFHFNAVVFYTTACEKEFLVELKKEDEDAVNSNFHPKNTKKEPGMESGTSYHSQNPYFILTMKPSHAYKHGAVTIPAEFVRSNSLKHLSTVNLINPCGEAWPVRIFNENACQRRHRMRQGWHDFYVSNKLKDGDVCTFDLNRCTQTSTNVTMNVQVFRAPI